MKIQELEVGKLYKQCKNEMDIYKINKSGKLFVKADGVPNNYFNESCLSYNTVKELDFEEYEMPIKWEYIPVDTKVLVRDSTSTDWKPRHFAEYKDGKVYCFLDGRTSFTSKSTAIVWNYCKLFKKENKMVLGNIQFYKKDPFFVEEDEMIKYIEEYSLKEGK